MLVSTGSTALHILTLSYAGFPTVGT